MEARKESLSGLKICRFCLTQDDNLTSLYKKSRIPKNAFSLPLKILHSVGIEVFPSDKMPIYICGQCQFFIEISYEYKRICRQADENILHYIQTGSALESLAWPKALTKVYRECKGKPPNEVSVMKAVVEDGTTVQVTTEDLSDTDIDDDENVYNIKIGDTSDEGSKNASIKVSDKEETPKAKPKRGAKVPTSVLGERMRTRSGAEEEGTWPCTQCNIIFPLRRLLDSHKGQKHKGRTEECDQCGAKFFTKYDMQVHQARHVNDLPFQCSACEKTFKRLILLKKHQKLYHADMPQHKCPNCPASFLSTSELQEHKKKHVRLQPRVDYQCMICEKIFVDNAALMRHMDSEHDPDQQYTCDYCDERFSSLPKLAKHVRSHTGGRTYPCKFCDKTFVKSHHYTRHLRMKHRATIRNRRGPFGEVEEYRCDQCEANFASQDDLIYHSAIHATQNLTCPLCQEKFDDVEAVTMHIKSHANGSEFMCDYCELIFTTKSKLDNHIAIAHEEEVRCESMEQDESSVEMDGEEDDDDNAINIKEEDGEMVLEIKKADDFMLTNYQGESEDKLDNTNSEDSEIETFPDVPVAIQNKEAKALQEKSAKQDPQAQLPTVSKTAEKTDNQSVSIIRKAEEIKRKSMQQKVSDNGSEKKEKLINKGESTTNAGANDKSLRLLEKELQELKRTNTRAETVRITARGLETVRNRRPQIHTSTPKIRNLDEKKLQSMLKTTPVEKKGVERRLITKENKEPKDIKNNNDKEKTVVKNGTNDKSNTEEGVRRSTRPSKIKDYAKMIRESSQDSDATEDDSDELEDDDDEEFKETERTPEPPRPKVRRGSMKATPVRAGSSSVAVTSAPATPPAPPATPAVAPRKRGRPRKDTPQVPNKLKKDDEENDPAKQEKVEQENNAKPKQQEPSTSAEKAEEVKKLKPEAGAIPSPTVLVSPTGQTLKKVPVKSLPPGVKALPLPVNARLGNAELCEMQIGKKVVKVQKIVMTKAEVEAMAKKGLVEMKDGTMVLKQGIKLPQQDTAIMKQSLVDGGETNKESPNKKDKATPTRCDFGEDTL